MKFIFIQFLAMDLLSLALARKRLSSSSSSSSSTALVADEDFFGEECAPLDIVAIAPGSSAPNLTIVNGWKLKVFRNGKAGMRQVSFPIGTSRKKPALVYTPDVGTPHPSTDPPTLQSPYRNNQH